MINPSKAIRILFFAIVVAPAVAGASCGDMDEPARPEAQTVTLHVEDAPLWSLGSSFQVGQDADDPLGNVVGGVFAAPGLVAVGDGLNNRVVLADSAGRVVRAVGRTGMGPLEFVELWSIERWPGDSVFAWDSRARRYSVFSSETGGGRTAVPEGIETPVAAALPGSGGGLWIIGVILTEPMDFKRSGRFRLQRDIGYWKGLGRVDKVASVGGPQFVGTTRVPAGPRSIFAAGDGLMFLTEGEQPTVSILETSGFMRRKIRVEGMAIEIADAMHEPYVETLVAQQEEARGRAGYDPSSAAEGVARALRAAPLPKEMEAIGRIVFARDGTLWLCQRGWPGVDEHWVNVTTEGVPIRRVLMPSKMTMLDAAEDRLLLAWLDSMDLTRVEVHAIVAVPG